MWSGRVARYSLRFSFSSQNRKPKTLGTKKTVTVAKVPEGELDRDHIDEASFAGELSLAGIPDPDLLIRTGGERRISNFLLWNLAYAELWFTDCLWPDFREGQFDEALDYFASRQRRYGYTGDQVA